MSTTTASGIQELSLVCVPSNDQDRAIAFYQSLGFEKRTDIPFGGDYRWVEVYLAKSATGIALAPPPPGQSAQPSQTGIALTTDDIDATHGYMRRSASMSTPRSPGWATRSRRCSGSAIRTATR